jgi:hypothetical protein
MADNKDIRDGRDRDHVAGDEDYEIRHMANKMGISQEEVKRAIEQVGNDRQKLEDYLRKNSKR